MVKDSKEEKFFRIFAFNSKYIIYNKGEEVTKMVFFYKKIKGSMVKKIKILR